MEQLIGKENKKIEINWTLLKIKVDQENLNLMDVDAQNIENSTMPCKHCGVEFTTKSDLHDHIRITHTDNVDEIETHEKEMPNK